MPNVILAYRRGLLPFLRNSSDLVLIHSPRFGNFPGLSSSLLYAIRGDAFSYGVQTVIGYGGLNIEKISRSYFLSLPFAYRASLVLTPLLRGSTPEAIASKLVAC